MAAFGRQSMNLSGDGEPERWRAARASADLLPLLRVSPLVGRTFGDIEASSVRVQRFSAMLLALFAGVALFLAALGLAGVAAYSVSQRTYEIGVRKACGAREVDVARMILRETFELAVPGIGVGLVCSLAVARTMSSLLFGIGTGDPVTFVAVPALLLLVTGLASVVPALWASRVDALVALRSE